MAEDGTIGHGIIFERGDSASPEVWTKIGEITEPAFPSPSRDTPEVTHTESPDRYREFISGLRDGNEIAPTMLLNMGSDSYAELFADFDSDDPGHYRAVSPDGTKAWGFMAFLTSAEHETPIDETNHITPTFKITGKPVLVDLP